MDKQPQIIVITGPTAAGKTAHGVFVAKTLGGEIVSADSMQVYKHMNIGTAKPTEEEMQGVPHHMLDIVSPFEDYSVSRYVEDAALCIDDIVRRGKTPILVGGTGLYIDSLLSGRGFLARGDAALRSNLEKEYDDLGGEALLGRLKEVDPESAARLHANDKKRIIRAIEVYMATGKTISQHDMETKALPPRYDVKKYALTFSNRAELYERIDKRVDTMIEKGLPDEVQSLFDMGVTADCTSMQAIGYKEMTDVILGKCDINSAIEKIKMESRRYAKRQLTWFRRDPEIEWLIND